MLRSHRLRVQFQPRRMKMDTNGIPQSKDTGTVPLEVKVTGSPTSLENGTETGAIFSPK